VPSSARSPSLVTDRAGFIVNALLFPYLNDAVHAGARYATEDDIDVAMKRSCGAIRWGPGCWMSLALDVSLAIQRTLYLEFREPGFAPARCWSTLTTAGYLGRKTGRGFRSLRRPGLMTHASSTSSQPELEFAVWRVTTSAGDEGARRTTAPTRQSVRSTTGED
jgi:3-hydroxyacyl-CoA dehydrogenase